MFGIWRRYMKGGVTDRVYLDYAAATPVRAEVLAAMRPYFETSFANPGAIHAEGQSAVQAVTKARASIATYMRVRDEEITFTSGGTEANNLALFGVVEAAVQHGRPYEDIEIISTEIEHPSILQALAVLEAQEVTVHYVPVDEGGRIVTAEFAKLVSPKTLLVSVAYANSEVGVIQDIKQLVRIAKKQATENQQLFIHIDASQAPLWLPIRMDSLGVDLMTLDAGKCCGPKGVGVLAHKGRVPLVPQILGGGQERGMRAGTENVPLIVGCAEALRYACEGQAARAERVAALRDVFIQELHTAIPGAVLNGSATHRVANNVNISLPGVDGEFAVVTLDTHGVAASTRSACAGGTGSGSHVVRTLSGDEARAATTVRFTLGEATTRTDIMKAVTVLKEHVAAMQTFTEEHTAAPSRILTKR